jgi:y4mF family transcriptional regulator
MKSLIFIVNIPFRVYFMVMKQRKNDNPIAQFVRNERRKRGLTQEEFALRSGVGLRFLRELENGKTTVRLDKVNDVLRMFGSEVGVQHKNNG